MTVECNLTPLRLFLVIETLSSPSVINIISQKRRATVGEIKEELDSRFKEKDLNVYYYLSVLKKQGLVNVTIEGRQRYYSLR